MVAQTQPFDLIISISPFWKTSLDSTLSLLRFGADSPGNSPGKFARPGPAQSELHQQLVSGQRAGEHAGELSGVKAIYFQDFV